MRFSSLDMWIGLSALALALGGCAGDLDPSSETTVNTTNNTMMTNNGSSTGSDLTTGGEMTTGSVESTGTPGSTGADSTTGTEEMCDPPCEAGQQCLGGQCFDVDDSSGGTPDSSDYGPCGMCAPGESPIMVMGIEGCFCSPMCDGMMCPAPNEGTAMPQCALGAMPGNPTQCALVCQLAGDDCPAGATCQDIMMGGLGICTHPSP